MGSQGKKLETWKELKKTRKGLTYKAIEKQVVDIDDGPNPEYLIRKKESCTRALKWRLGLSEE